MIYKPMPVADLKKLHQKIQKPIFVRFPKNNKQTFLFNNSKGHLCYYKGHISYDDCILLYNEHKAVSTSIQELVVAMTWETYDLHKLTDDADYELALAVFEQYFDSPLDSDEGRFAYLLSLVIADYESQHYPIAISSTVDFIDDLLEERGLSWTDIKTYLGYGTLVSDDYIRSIYSSSVVSVENIVKLSHFFKLPVQAFIVGGYDA